MRTNPWYIAALAVVLACAVAGTAHAAQHSTNVTVTFVEATDFEEPPIPLSDGTKTDGIASPKLAVFIGAFSVGAIAAAQVTRHRELCKGDERS